MKLALLALVLAAPPTVQVYQDGGRVGVANEVINCIGPVRCNVTNNAVRVSLDDAGTGTSFPVPPVCGDGGNALGWDGGAFTCNTLTSARQWMVASGLSASPDLNAGDHLKFDTVVGSGGSDITLDTATTYTNQNAVASKGRFTLATGHTYHFVAHGGFWEFNTSSLAQVVWVNAETGAPLGQGAFIVPATYVAAHQGGAGSFEGTITTSASTRVEVRIMYQSGWTKWGTDSTGPDAGAFGLRPTAYLEEML